MVGRSLDGWTAGFPTDVALDGRAALVALEMNGQPLPRVHGLPARLVVAGLYGYVSATKWLEEIELTTLEAFDGYWVRRGWAKRAPVKIQSRIDVPRLGTALRRGVHPVARVARAPPNGIGAVEISVDEGPWTAATLAEEVNPATWRHWRYDWDAGPGPPRSPGAGRGPAGVRASRPTGAPLARRRHWVPHRPGSSGLSGGPGR